MPYTGDTGIDQPSQHMQSEWSTSPQITIADYAQSFILLVIAKYFYMVNADKSSSAGKWAPKINNNKKSRPKKD